MKSLTSRQIIGLIMAATNMLGPEYAKSIGCAKSTLYDVASGDLKATPRSIYVREAISKTIGKPIAEIWVEAESTTH